MSKPAILRPHVRRSMLEWLAKSRERAGARLPSDRQFAKIFKVSALTVADVLEELEAEGLVERIPRSGTYVRRKVVKPELFDIYFPAAWRAALVANDTRHHSYAIYRNFFDGIVNACADLEVAPVFHYASPTFFKERPHSKITLDSAGTLYVIYGDEETFAFARENGARYLRLTIDTARAPNEFGRDDRAIREGLTHLYQMGHRNFGMLGVGPRDYDKEPMQNEAFFDWMAAHGLQAGKGDVIDLGTPKDPGRVIATYLGRDRLPTAVFCASSVYAGIFFSVAEKLAIRIPEDMSVFTHGDPMTFPDARVNLTLADPLSYQHAYDATLKLIQMARAGEMTCAPIAADCRFHPGRTCAPCLGEWFYPRDRG